MKAKRKLVITGIALSLAGEERHVKYFTQKRWTCPWCWDKGAYGRGGFSKLDALCEESKSGCGAKVIRVNTKEVEKPKVIRLLDTKDNRGNPLRVATCGDNPEAYRKGVRCEQPCLIIGGTNVNTNSVRSHTIHMTPEQAKTVIEALQEGLKVACEMEKR